jgi:hypothetical protein
MKAIVIAAASAAIIATAPAQAQWHILDFVDEVCRPAAGTMQASAPWDEHLALRSEGFADHMEEAKDEVGRVWAVSIAFTYQGRDVTLWWFPTLADCERGKQVLANMGVVHNKQDLQ